MASEPSKTGDRFNTGKPEVTMVLEARNAIAGAAQVLTFGKAKYSRGNWRKGMKHTVPADCLARHLMAWLSGEDRDPESGELHVDHITVNALFLAEFTRTHPDMDDRPIIAGVPQESVR